MPKLSAGPRQRMLAAMVALCYFWLSTIVACQHTHHALDELASAPHLGSNHANGNSRSAFARTNADVKAALKIDNASHCAACDWQTASVSPAMSAFALSLTLPGSPRIITTFTRYLWFRVPIASSRAPPLA